MRACEVLALLYFFFNIQITDGALCRQEEKHGGSRGEYRTDEINAMHPTTFPVISEKRQMPYFSVQAGDTVGERME